MRYERLIEQARSAVLAQEYASAMKDSGRLRFLADDEDCPDMMRLAALAEELGEVGRCLHDDTGNLRAELDQLAGIAIAWASILE